MGPWEHSLKGEELLTNYVIINTGCEVEVQIVTLIWAEWVDKLYKLYLLRRTFQYKFICLVETMGGEGGFLKFNCWIKKFVLPVLSLQMNPRQGSILFPVTASARVQGRLSKNKTKFQKLFNNSCKCFTPILYDYERHHKHFLDSRPLLDDPSKHLNYKKEYFRNTKENYIHKLFII